MLKNARAFSHHKNVENEPTTVTRSRLWEACIYSKYSCEGRRFV